MTHELLVANVCDANETHIEHPFGKDQIVGGWYVGSMFNPRTMSMEPITCESWGEVPEFVTELKEQIRSRRQDQT